VETTHLKPEAKYVQVNEHETNLWLGPWVIITVQLQGGEDAACAEAFADHAHPTQPLSSGSTPLQSGAPRFMVLTWKPEFEVALLSEWGRPRIKGTTAGAAHSARAQVFVFRRGASPPL
jgi:hypothetical protein